MSRDHTKLKVFEMANALALDVYRRTSGFPSEERFGLQSQIRRAAVSVPTNVVEGCSKRSEKEFLRFLDIAVGSASEARYLAGLARQLEFLSPADDLEPRFGEVVKALHGLIRSISRAED